MPFLPALLQAPLAAAPPVSALAARVGALDCLVAAALWAVSVALFRGPVETLGARATNFFKCAVATILYWGWIAAFGPHGSWGTPGQWLSLAASGVLGFTFGDMCLFISMREGGVQRAPALFNLSPLLAALAAIPLLHELPQPIAWIGMLLVLAGVLMVETDPRRAAARRADASAKRRPWLATLAGLGAALGQAAGVLFSRGPLTEMPVLPGTAIRVAAGALTLLPLLFFVGGPARRRPIDHLGPRNWRSLALPTLLGTVIALLFAMSGIARLETGIAASLLATTPIFALPISRFALKEPLGPRSALGTLLAVYGVYLLS